ncbi:MAG: SRPBCC family protein [Bacteroidota bacterium]|nr:SRPBCC family protein [Bacteroidota bacterium]
MRSVKLFIVAVVILLAFLFVITLFLPSKVTVSKSTTINAGENKVMAQLIDFNNWKNWYPAIQDENVSVNISPANKNLLEIYSITKHGKLSITLLVSKKDSVTFSVAQGEKNNQTYQFAMVPNGEAKTLLTWNINVDLGPYPWKKFIGIFLDKISGPSYDDALQKLKTAAEIK